jgi:peptidoglycan/xylan/chitin deacetylase (PgdA/CDA1 family)
MKLTVLMYHKVDALQPEVRYPGNYVAPAAFEQQMDALLDWGYRTIGFDEWMDHVHGRAPLPDKPLIVTFDDGYTCFDRNAWPVLRARNMTATVFLVSSQIGGTNVWDADERQERLLDAPRILALQREGARFGSHTHTHRALATLSPADAFDELTRSRVALTALLGRDVDVIAYPFSNQSDRVRQLARQAGYRCAVRGKGRMNRPSTDPFGLRRIKVEQHETVASLRWKLMRERYLRL